MPSGMYLQGLEKVTQNIQRLAVRYPRKMAEAVKAEMEIEKAESVKRTPKDTGKLRLSHRVMEPVVSSDGVLGVIEVTMPYAINVHEDLTAFHKIGQAKFLESTLFESRRFMGTRLARRLNVATERF